jgi:hypothetical protein
MIVTQVPAQQFRNSSSVFRALRRIGEALHRQPCYLRIGVVITRFKGDFQ